MVLLAVDFSERGIGVHGFAGKPALARATAKYQYLFLNGRYIRDRSLFHAIKEAYRGLIEPAAQPVAIIFSTSGIGRTVAWNASPLGRVAPRLF